MQNGLKICWGIASNGTITFPFSFSSVPFVVLTFHNPNSNIYMFAHTTEKTVTGATYTGGYTDGGGKFIKYLNIITWIAIGY